MTKPIATNNSSMYKIAALAVIVAGMVAAQAIIVQILLGLFISIICAQPIFWLHKKGIPHMMAIVMVLTGIVIVFIGLGGIVSQSLGQFSDNMPTYRENLNTVVASFNGTFGSYNLRIGDNQLLDKIDSGKIFGLTTSLLKSVSGLLSESLLILLIAIFTLSETFIMSNKLTSLTKSYGQSFEYLNEIGKSVRHYLSLKTIVSLITGAFITIWLSIIGVDYAILWGLIAFLFNFIPNIGSILAAFPTMLLALVQLGVAGMAWTGLGYFVINMVVGNMVEPRIMGKGLGLSTLVVFLSLIIWGSILGTVGMLLSVPLTMALKIVLSKSKDTQWISFLLGSEEDMEEKLVDEIQE